MLASALLAAALTACGGGPIRSRISPEQFEEAIQSVQQPVAVLLWADWSRPAVEILPTAAELAQEYESSVLFWTVSLQESEVKPKGFPLGARHFTLEEDPTITLSRFGLQDVPAVLLYAPGGELRMTLGSSDAAPLAPADLADAIEELTGVEGFRL